MAHRLLGFNNLYAVDWTSRNRTRIQRDWSNRIEADKYFDRVIVSELALSIDMYECPTGKVLRKWCA